MFREIENFKRLYALRSLLKNLGLKAQLNVSGIDVILNKLLLIENQTRNIQEALKKSKGFQD